MPRLSSATIRIFAALAALLIMTAVAVVSTGPTKARAQDSSFFGVDSGAPSASQSYQPRQRPSRSSRSSQPAQPAQSPQASLNFGNWFAQPVQQAAPEERPRSRNRARSRSTSRVATYERPAAEYSEDGGSGSYCVRTCDGRYFPVSGNSEQSRAAICSSLCPASETAIFSGSTIDDATNSAGKSYSSLPNAFKYREKFVSGCTCNGKDPVGLASVSIDDDKTLQKGDIVAGENGLIVATRLGDKKRGKVAGFSPAPQSIRAKFEQSHAMARSALALKKKASRERGRADQDDSESPDNGTPGSSER
ncbi:DUF2865 domain-containing protein [Bradyrhizobium sp. LHD-71]|uniref:DUF2865 domain-containing protein n=1 Tax=Bradyrhizobium sp. LHD-71 TaxID=3072141 RepID=UPI00280F33CF|nr:DUF2865 domain-containing protein [Bradyrhizobium sp. LHD-71]MDQ8727042.1 DUF2865 domain-containing protein [Bradyrhizobium sp. LHD-71]